jgi:CubicO group peptidase (beta-lactamase class C family)
MAVRKMDLDRAIALVEAAVREGGVAAAALEVRRGGFRLARAFGRISGTRTPFLLASITKPMTAAGVMLLTDRGQLRLDDPVRKFIPEFTGGGREAVTVRHLLTHTSGLPDMLPENEELRKKHAGLAAFVAGACRTPLLFQPGAEVRYQSMGILLAAEIAERIARTPFRDFLRQNVFLPLGMRQTWLGLGSLAISRTALCQITEPSDWDWNSPYWRDLGVPWGGAHAPTGDVSRFLEAFLRPDGRVLKPQTARMMVTNQTAKHRERWGLGWRLQNPGMFGKACSAATFGHYGSTGTIAWADPATGISCVLLTTLPAVQSRTLVLNPVSDAVAS